MPFRTQRALSAGRGPAVVALTTALLLTSCAGATQVKLQDADAASTGTDAAGADSTAPETAADTTTTTTIVDSGPPADQRTLRQLTTITEGRLSPKSVVFSPGGRFFAQNMMYQHSITVYDREFNLVKDLDDSVTLSDYGIDTNGGGTVQGAPVEAAHTHDGRHMWISNYQMYGSGFDNPGNDKCEPGNWDPSYLYKVNTETLAIDDVVEVGPVPKFVAVTPDDSTVLVTNWCGFDMSIVDAESGTETSRLDIGRYPRGIDISPDGSTAYVAVMGGSEIAVVDLATLSIEWINDVGRGPRHLVLSPDGKFLYATLNQAGEVIKIDVASRTVVGRVESPQAPRSMEISADGTVLYVVNYSSDAMSKIRTSDMTQLQRLSTGYHPIGITVDPATSQVWVANYGGSLMVYADE